MADRTHWDKIYTAQPADTLSWHQAHVERSLALIEACGIAPDAPLIDVGGGASTLVADLCARGYRDLWLLDLSAAALELARKALGDHAAQVRFVAGDVCRVALPAAHFALWHDRAVFHFLTEPAQRTAYVAQALRAVAPGGHLIVATFAEDGPTQCSGLPVVRYSAEALAAQFAAGCELVTSERETHVTPRGAAQSFVYCLLRRHAGPERPAR